jgi:RES domain-containing protein
MGQAKHEWMEAQERGWSAPDKFVCQNCVEDSYLKQLIAMNLTGNLCDYCGEAAEAAPVECLMEAISYGLHTEFNDFESAGCPYDNEMPEIPTDTTEDALASIPLECHEDLFTDIAESFHNDQWVSAPGGWWAGSHTHDNLRWSWERFAHAVKHQTRFHFGSQSSAQSSDPGEVSVADFLPLLSKLVERHGLLRDLPAKTKVYRVRVREEGATWAMDAEQLGAPPPERTRAGRMNPAGIPYLYTAFSQGTAVAETLSRPPQSVAMASYVTAEEMKILDLSKLPQVPSPFDAAKRSERDELIFLANFVWDIKQPVQKDGSEHIDYVPTQVICEFFAQAFQSSSNKKLRVAGIKYPSAVHPEHNNLVFFPRNEDYRNPFGHVSFETAKALDFKTWADLTNFLVHY